LVAPLGLGSLVKCFWRTN